MKVSIPTEVLLVALLTLSHAAEEKLHRTSFSEIFGKSNNINTIRHLNEAKNRNRMLWLKTENVHNTAAHSDEGVKVVKATSHGDEVQYVAPAKTTEASNNHHHSTNTVQVVKETSHGKEVHEVPATAHGTTNKHTNTTSGGGMRHHNTATTDSSVANINPANGTSGTIIHKPEPQPDTQPVASSEVVNPANGTSGTIIHKPDPQPDTQPVTSSEVINPANGTSETIIHKPDSQPDTQPDTSSGIVNPANGTSDTIIHKPDPQPDTQPVTSSGAVVNPANGTSGTIIHTPDPQPDTQPVTSSEVNPANGTSGTIIHKPDPQPDTTPVTSSGGVVNPANGTSGTILSRPKSEGTTAEQKAAESIAGFPASEAAADVEDYVKAQEHKEEAAAEKISGFPASEAAADLEDYIKSQEDEKEAAGEAAAEKITGFPASEAAANLEDYIKAQGEINGQKPFVDDDDTKSTTTIFFGDTDEDSKAWWEHPFCAEDELAVILYMRADEYASDDHGILIYEHVTESYEIVAIGDILDEELYNEQVCLPIDTCYEFYLFDSGGDGFQSGGLFLDAGGVNMLDVRPQSEGHTDSDIQFFAAYFGEECESLGFDDKFGEIDKISVEAMEIIMSDAVDAAPTYISECAADSHVQIEMDLVVDEYSKFDNAIALYNIDDADDIDKYIWAYDTGAFQEDEGTLYQWSVCVKQDDCTVFAFYDEFGDDVYSPGSLKLVVDGEEVLNLENDTDPDDRTRNDAEEAIYSVDIGNCVEAQSHGRRHR